MTIRAGVPIAIGGAASEVVGLMNMNNRNNGLFIILIDSKV